KAQVAARPAAVHARAFAYDAKRETVLEGTVVGYTESAQIAPTGAHATVQTTSGDVDVHLGPASYLQAKHFSLAAGEQVRFAGLDGFGAVCRGLRRRWRQQWRPTASTAEVHER